MPLVGPACCPGTAPALPPEPASAGTRTASPALQPLARRQEAYHVQFQLWIFFSLNLLSLANWSFPWSLYQYRSIGYKKVIIGKMKKGSEYLPLID